MRIWQRNTFVTELAAVLVYILGLFINKRHNYSQPSLSSTPHRPATKAKLWRTSLYAKQTYTKHRQVPHRCGNLGFAFSSRMSITASVNFKGEFHLIFLQNRKLNNHFRDTCKCLRHGWLSYVHWFLCFELLNSWRK